MSGISRGLRGGCYRRSLTYIASSEDRFRSGPVAAVLHIDLPCREKTITDQKKAVTTNYTLIITVNQRCSPIVRIAAKLNEKKENQRLLLSIFNIRIYGKVILKRIKYHCKNIRRLTVEIMSVKNKY